MKKSILLLASLMFLATFTSCFKDKEGEYKPKEKISRIYKDYGDGDGKELREVWNWDKKQLQRIDHYYDGYLDWSEEFTYNKKGQIERVDCYECGEYTEYTYDGRKLSKSTCYEDGSIYEEYKFKHDGNKITKIEILYFYNRGSRDNSRLRKEGYNPLRILLPENDYQTLVKVIENNPASRGGMVTVKLEWEKKNVSKIEVTSGSDRYTVELKYDDKLNPLKNFFSLYPEDAFADESDYSLSKNNVVEERFIEDGETEIDKYSYSYDGKFPTVKRYTYSYKIPIWDNYIDSIIGYETGTRTTSTYYEYE